jgi:hypothetical protein
MMGKKAAPKDLNTLVEQWTRSSESNQHLGTIRDLIWFLTRELYEQYKPHGDKLPMWDRLTQWIANVSSERDQQTFVELVVWLLFVGSEEMDSMYRAALHGPITRWLIDQAGLDITSPDLAIQLRAEVKRTFFGSMAGAHVDEFQRINGIGGQSIRLPFRDLAKVGDIKKLQSQLKKGNYQRIVAIEDIVGTGSQMFEAAEFLVNATSKSALLCPLLIAPAGVELWKTRIRHLGTNLYFEPLNVIPKNAMVPMLKPSWAEPELLTRLRKLVTKTWPKVKGSRPNPAMFSEHGFGCGELGLLVLTYLNCPDNALPLIHNKDSDQWDSLFPRTPREA